MEIVSSQESITFVALAVFAAGELKNAGGKTASGT
jgi:hypothetical protein